MRLLAPLRPAHTLARGTILKRAAVLATLALVERVLAPVTAWVLFTRPFAMKLALSLGLGAVFTVRTFLVRSFAARTEADVMDRAIACVLDGDVLASVLPGEDAHAELGQGVYASALQLSDVLPALVGDIVAAFFLTIVIFAVEPAQLVLGATALMVVAAFGLMWSRGRLQGAAQAAWDKHEKLQDAMVDALEGRLEIVASGQRDAFATLAHDRARAWGTAGVRMAASSLISGRLPLLAMTCAVAILVVADSRLRGFLSVSLADLALFASVTPAFAGIGQGVLALVQAEPWVRAVAKVVEGARPRRGGDRVLPPTQTPIVFEAVSFRYEGAETNALTEVDFHWQDERSIALVGANGSGKSTCLRLLLALGDPSAGHVRIGGIDLTALDADAWRRSIGFLPQRPYLPLRADIRTTVRLLAPAASDARIESALDRVGLLPALVRAGPDALAVRIETLSVGQRQRVALARILCREASFFVFDEPDANLDREGVALVIDIVRSLSRDHKVIVVAHTPELIDVTDRVIELDGGRISRDERRARA